DDLVTGVQTCALPISNGDVFLSERGAGKITVLRDSKGRGVADQRFTFVSGLNKPQGMAFRDGYFYYSDLMAVWRVAYRPGQTARSEERRVGEEGRCRG